MPFDLVFSGAAGRGRDGRFSGGMSRNPNYEEAPRNQSEALTMLAEVGVTQFGLGYLQGSSRTGQMYEPIKGLPLDLLLGLGLGAVSMMGYGWQYSEHLQNIAAGSIGWYLGNLGVYMGRPRTAGTVATAGVGAGWNNEYQRAFQHELRQGMPQQSTAENLADMASGFVGSHG